MIYDQKTAHGFDLRILFILGINSMLCYRYRQKVKCTGANTTVEILPAKNINFLFTSEISE